MGNNGEEGEPWAVKEPQKNLWRWTYTRYSLVADEEQKKKVYVSLWVILLKGAMAFLISSNGANCKKDWETLIYFNTRKKVYRANEDNKAYVNNFMKKIFF